MKNKLKIVIGLAVMLVGLKVNACDSPQGFNFTLQAGQTNVITYDLTDCSGQINNLTVQVYGMTGGGSNGIKPLQGNKLQLSGENLTTNEQISPTNYAYRIVFTGNSVGSVIKITLISTSNRDLSLGVSIVY